MEVMFVRKAPLCILLVLVMIFTALPLTAHAASEHIAEGYDRYIYWYVDSVPELGGDWRLTVEPKTAGTSVAMPDYSLTKDYYSTAPWCDSKNSRFANLKEIVIADGITHIGDCAFFPKGGGSVYSNLKYADHFSLKMADSVTSVGYRSFANMGLDSIEWSENLKTIGEQAFYCNEKLLFLDLPSSLTTIGKEAFWICDGATFVRFGTNVTEIAEGVFSRCDSLTDVYYPGTPAQFNQISIAEKNNADFLNAKVHVPLTGSVDITVSQGVALDKQLFVSLSGMAKQLDVKNLIWGRSDDGKTGWTSIGHESAYTIQKADSEKYLRVSVFDGEMTVDGRKFYTDGVLVSPSLKMPEFPICEIRAVLNISKDVDVKIWRRVYINGEQKHRYDGTIADGADKKYTWIPGLYKGNYTLELAPASTYVPRTYEIDVKGEEWLDVELYMYGDVNQNGKVQANDAMLVYKHTQGKAQDQLTGYALQCADANGNGKVQSNDAMLIYQQAQGKHTLF